MATAAEAAAHLFMNDRKFYEHLTNGVITRQSTGGYDLDVVRREYIEHLRAVAARHGSPATPSDGLDLTQERAALAREQKIAQEMKNQVARGELLPRPDVHQAMTGAFSRCRSKLVALPSKVAPLVLSAGTLAEARETLSNAVNEALGELSETIIAGIPAPERVAGDAGGGAGLVEDLDPTPDADGEPVGRSRKAAERGGKLRAR
jgi:hypothetical protein